MHRKPGDIVTWQALNKCLFESDFDLEILTDLINDRQFPSYSKSSSLSDQDICEAKETFNNLFDWLIQSYSRQCFPPTRFCFMVEGIVRGNLALFERPTYVSLLNVLLDIDTSQPNSEHCQKLAAALSSVLYLRPVDYRIGPVSANISTHCAAFSNPDFLDHQRGEMSLEKLISLLQSSQNNFKIELSCLHAMVQLICHRKLLQWSQSSVEKLSCIVRVVNTLWPIALTTLSKRQADGGVSLESSSSSSYVSSSASSCGELSDGSEAIVYSEVSSAVRQKRIRLLAAFCLRPLLMSKRVCQEVWSADAKQSFQIALMSAVSQERDSRLREIFITIFGNVLSNMEFRFSIAEELSNRESASFIPYSVRLAGELRIMHRSLNWALLTEKSFRHQLALLKAIASLVAITPYHRLHAGLLTSLANTLNSFAMRAQKDPVKRSACQSNVLAIWSTVLAKPLTAELQKLLTTESDVTTFLGNLKTKSSSCWLIDLCLQALSEGGASSENKNGIKPTPVRFQAVSTLRAFVPLHYDLLIPSLGAIKLMIRDNLQSQKDDNRPFRAHLLTFCDALLIHQYGCLEKRKYSDLSLDCNWWYNVIGTLIDSAWMSPNSSECWWTCEVIGVFFDLLAFIEASNSSALQITLNPLVYSSLCSRSVDLFTHLCDSPNVETKSKALRRLCRLAILDALFIPSTLLSKALDVLLQINLNSSSTSSSLTSEVAYCLELCTLKALNSFHLTTPETWNLNKLLQEALNLSSFQDRNLSTWSRLDGRRCEHAIHSLVNIIQMKPLEVEAVEDVLDVFRAYLHVAELNGAPKIRWNAALAAGRLMEFPSRSSIVEGLCEVFACDSYFKARVHAGLSLLLLFNDKFPKPNPEEVKMVISCALRFLSTESQHGPSTTINFEATHHIVLCFHIASRLLLLGVINALQNASGEYQSDLKSILCALDESQILSANLRACLHFAKEAKTAAFAVMKAARRGIDGGGLARVPNQPMLISFAERYDPLKCLNFDEALSDFFVILGTFESELRQNKAKELVRLFYLITNGSALPELRETPLKHSDDRCFRTTYD